MTLDIGGVRLLTDPLLTDRLAHLRRIGSPVPPPDAARPDVVLVSHLHQDHLHRPSLERIRDGATLVVPSGAGRLARASVSGPVRELDIGDTVDLGVSVRAVRAEHDGRRLPGSSTRGPALGYLIEHDDTRIWFAGDTGLFPGMAELGEVDVAVLPVGGWGPTLGPGHLDPEQAARAARLVRARHVVPVHYGTFWPVGLRRVAPGTFRYLFEQPGVRFARAVEREDAVAAAAGRAIHVLRPGGAVELDG